MNENAELDVQTEWIARGYKVTKRTSMFDSKCVSNAREDSRLQVEAIHISDGVEEIVLVDPALSVISNDLETVLDDAEAGIDSQDAVKCLLMILNGANVR